MRRGIELEYDSTMKDMLIDKLKNITKIAVEGITESIWQIFSDFRLNHLSDLQESTCNMR